MHRSKESPVTTSLDGDPRRRPPWQDPALPVAERVELLLAAMTLEEKVAQLGSRWVGNDMQRHRAGSPTTDEHDLNVAPMQDVFAAGGPRRWRRRAGTGSATSPGSTAAPRSPPRRARPSWCASSAWWSTASRLGIPALVHEECLTGFTAYGATVYPAAIAWGATFDPDLVERMAAAIGRDMAARRRAPGPVAGARRRARLPLGPGRGDHGRGPVPRRDARRRPTCAACRAPA